MLFHGNPSLIQGFNTFLPPGYRIDVSLDPRNQNTIMVTTPMGTTTQSTNAFGAPIRIPRENGLTPGVHTPGGMPLPMFPSHGPFGGAAPPPILPVGLGPGSRPASPLGHPAPHMLLGAERPLHPNMFSTDMPQPYSPATQGAQAQNAAASVLGGMGAGSRTVERSAVEFNHAIHFLNKIKIRYSDDTEIYKQFLDILQTYQKEQKQLHDVSPLFDPANLRWLRLWSVAKSQVFAQVSRLFKDAPELMEEFKAFLPEVLGPSSSGAGLIGIMPHPSAAATQPAGWDHGETVTAPAEKVKAPSRRRKRVSDKDSLLPQAPAKASGGRVRATTVVFSPPIEVVSDLLSPRATEHEKGEAES